MTTNNKAKSVGEDIINEINRINEEIKIYEELPNGVGMIGAHLMRQSVQNATEALASGDVIRILEAYQDLKGYKG